jgi:hypothetical protein
MIDSKISQGSITHSKNSVPQIKSNQHNTITGELQLTSLCLVAEKTKET